jgi:hypothetical protein
MPPCRTAPSCGTQGNPIDVVMRHRNAFNNINLYIRTNYLVRFDNPDNFT